MEAKKYQVINGYIQFNTNSVSDSCVLITLSEISRETYALQPSRVPLSAEFFSYKSPIRYGITNRRGSFVGIIQNDGIRIQGEVNNFTICQVISRSNPDFPFKDIAMIYSSGGGTSSSFILQDAQLNGQDMVCVNFTMPSINGGNNNVTLFPVSRIADWRESKEFFNLEQRVMIYILAFIFGMCAVWGLFQLTGITYKLVTKIEVPKLVHALILSITA
ncbi:hypothetical protein SAMD00019534_046910 [Acytostelium subglobosum LB1]|uniref:hypothetical protein n=1 Tax=Acytostelium subglobosum LB1 TaxID=1410327 RepID=UPI0006447D9E|nr:hypothetical protein SAMD00019534_046910 [Acytostelium subglobosum LB1]GAM21516.1 hypothetical protein SAMD00019534_046910 [Acytostelium subglobosum LB1]|eukprot:XP_012755635.1 hypothetical protein SAMD00019534_046910 [Acytostelium subglobosum LB1]